MSAKQINQSIMLISAGRYQAAAELLYALINEHNTAPVNYYLGMALRGLGQHLKAEQHFQKCLNSKEFATLALREMADIYISQEDFFAAERALEQLIKHGDLKLEIQVGLANAYFNNDRYELAKEVYSKLYRERPEDGNIILRLAQVNQILGFTDEAVELNIKLTQLSAPNEQAQGYWQLSNLKNYQFDEQQGSAMHSLSDSTELEQEYKGMLHFALGNLYDSNKDNKQAVEHYSSANSLIAKLRPYRADLLDKFIRSLKTTFADAQKFDADSFDPRKTPVFIVGMPRAGSTLAEQILASHSDVEGTRELPYIQRITNYIEQSNERKLSQIFDEPFRRQCAEMYYGQAMQHLSTDKHYFIDKLPNNFLHIGFILSMFPNAKIIDVRRKPTDNCISAFKQYFAAGQNFSFSIDSFAHYYQTYVDLMQFWHESYADSIFTLQYEELLEQPEEQIKGMLKFLDLDFEVNCLEFYKSDRAVATPSANQVRQPLYKNSINISAPFEQHLPQFKNAFESLKSLS